MSADTEGGLAVCQLIKMHARGQISLEMFKQLTASVAGCSAELPIDPEAEASQPSLPVAQPAAEVQEDKLPAFANVLRAILANSPNSVPPERVFSILNNTFDDDQRRAHADYIELSLQLQFNARSRAPQ